MSKHQVRMDNRELLEIEGVIEVINFSDEQISLATELGPLLILGEDLNIQQLNLDNGELIVDGYINGLDYSQDDNGDGILSNLFK
ncbi:sporulation protein YabP [Acetohalobium arabaticum]|uniref:Sporulation protein YabP n=1 Tax=Acetohalobium arabaticum (strain ATCC 49924 / DSM 5501 / Z-7288) TaxID=574087 RepID=D9QSW1_ACEAZ|nr:sporulation protein YabP [Acetohalobium arabaticum]ADL11649.1 sporulation protein YabP [Acetohalobium arabaticum DSM 5501]